MRQKHLSGAEQIANHAHPGHKRTFDDIKWALAFLPRLLRVDIDVIDDSFDQRVLQAVFHTVRAPRFIFNRRLALRFYVLGKLDEPFGRVGSAIQQHIFHALAQPRLDLFVNGELTSIDNAHVESGPDRVKKKRRVHRLAHGVVSPKRKRNVAYTAAHARAWKIFFNPARRLDEIDRIVTMLLQTSCDSQDVWVENDIVRRETGALSQEFVSPRADVDLALECIGLALLIESHHDDGRAISPNESRLPKKFFLAIFQANRIDDRFALNAFQTRFDDAPLRAVDHKRDARDFRFASNQIQEARHCRLRIDHPFVHVHVENVRAALHLLTGHGQRAIEIIAEN